MLKEELNDSRQRLHLLEQVSFGQIYACSYIVSRLHRNKGRFFFITIDSPLPVSSCKHIILKSDALQS